MGKGIEAFAGMDNAKLIEIAEDPIKFTRHVIKKEPREYQIPMVKNDAKNIVSRCGRRVGKTYGMIFHMVWYGQTHANSTQLVIAPRGVQVDKIFEELRKIIDESPILSSTVKKSKEYPQTIKFHNGAIIRGLSAGTASGNKGENVRGQDADWIYLDECDYLDKKSLNSIMGVQLDDVEGTGIWAVSTPTGAEEMFFRWCKGASVTYTVDNYKDLNFVKKTRKDGNGWTQFHFPSMVHPNWNEKQEEKLREMFTKQGYIREVLAEFGEKEGGVYIKKFVEKATSVGYTYHDMRKRKLPVENPRIIGVDWDKAQNPTNIIVVEYLPNVKKLAVVYRKKIEPGEYTYDNAVKSIVKTFKSMGCNYVYCDAGHGEYQIEMLNKKLGRGAVKRCPFNKKVNVLDPVTRKNTKKELKDFMITQTAILLEREQIAFPSDDKDLTTSFKNYRIVRYTSNGKPVYNDDNEHGHDATTLAVYGFNEEYPDITDLIKKVQYAKAAKVSKKRLSDIKNIAEVFGSSFDDKKDKDEKDDPYVKRMKRIERATKANTRITSRGGFRSWGKRGGSSGAPSRKKL